jgi:hypothetical protein
MTEEQRNSLLAASGENIKNPTNAPENTGSRWDWNQAFGNITQLAGSLFGNASQPVIVNQPPQRNSNNVLVFVAGLLVVGTIIYFIRKK